MSEVEQEQPQEQEGEPEVEGVPVEQPTPDEEAEEAEHEHEQEQQEQQEQEPQEPSGAAGAVGEKELERMFKKVDAANAAYLKRLEGIMESEIEVLEKCPRCVAPFLGFIFPPMMQPVDADTKAAVLASVGEEAPHVSEPDPYSRRCDACHGWGRVLSGSRLNQQKTLQCLPCNGRGWVAVGDERRVAQQAITTPDMPAENGSPVEQPPDADPWGRGPNHPDYGRLPQFVGAS